MMTWLLAPITLVGLLTEQGQSVCKDGKETWVTTHYEVGFHPITLAAGGDLQRWLRQPVVVVGEPGPAPERAALADDGSCPPMQLRDDWVVSKDGIRRRRGDGPAPEHLRVTSVAPFTGLEVEVEGEQVRLVFTNTLAAALEDVELRVHYEGCYGKPGTALETRALGPVAPSERKTAEVPVRILRAESRGLEHVLHSVQVVARGGVRFDLDQPAPHVACQARKRRSIQLEP